MKRRTSVAGSFYPNRSIEIERYFEQFSAMYDEDNLLPKIASRVAIVPHAGYIYSGYTANVAYRVLQKSGIKKFVVIGPSHRVAFEGVSLCNFESYETPLGEIKGDSSMVQKLQERFPLECIASAHAEHSTEVQFPFIKYYIEDAQIVELIYSHESPGKLSKIVEFILEQEDFGVIISTDLSHFYNLEDAERLDNICLSAIKRLDTKVLHDGCEACGNIGIEAILLSAKELGMKPQILDYRTSADASGETDRVVGYVSVCFCE